MTFTAAILTAWSFPEEGSTMIGPDTMAGGGKAYRAGVATAVLASFLTVWTTIVRDDGQGAGFFLVIMAAVVGAFAAWFRPAGMARAMLGVAAMQAAFGFAVATAPVVARTADGAAKALVSSGVFAALWLISAAFFRAAAGRGRSNG